MNPIPILKQYFGYDSFREGQEELVLSILSGRDTLGIMPTGAGKSICYQVPALIFEGITLVVSPLISLMKDQVSALNEAGIHAAYINSSLSSGQISLALQYARKGQYRLIYVAQERLETEEFLAFALSAGIAMVTVDEAHCISQWGQDFRPSYLKIVEFIRKLPKRPVISAFTATATKDVMEDMICVLGLKEPKVILTGFDRKNLFFEVRTPRDKNAEVVDYVEKHPKDCGIIYCATRAGVDELQELLTGRGLKAARYHAGMNDKERNENQEDFIYDRKTVMIATNAFGMGIDKSNVRYVLHYNMPKNMESYYQEAGRAGRDGEAAECILLYGGKDVILNQYMIDNSFDNPEVSLEQKEIIRERDARRLKQMTYYCFTRDCLREYILNYFGQQGLSCCDNCSNCLTQFEELDVTEAAKDILGCIRECNQRYGINVITATLLGRKTAKLTSTNMIHNSFYGKRAAEGEHRLKQIVNKLIIDGYLYLTDDKYSVVKLDTSARQVEQDETGIIMKLAKEDNRVQNPDSGKPKRKSELLTSRGLELFEALRQVRTGLAREEGVPPYIIFSDKTLTDMCVKQPLNKEEMLEVSGVGENKFQKYGSYFLEAVQKFTNGTKQTLSYEPAGEETPAAAVPRKRNLKEPFYLTEAIKQGVKIEGTVMISEFVEQLNKLRDEQVMKRLASTQLTEKLMEEGYLEVSYYQELGRNMKHATSKGAEFGILTEKRISEKGYEYETLLYNEEAQYMLLSLLERV